MSTNSSLPSSPKNQNPDSLVHSIKVSIEEFEKVRLIGKGDVGRVYLVRYRPNGKLYAMKVLHKDEMIKRNKIKRALTEREILSIADHPFIVTLHWCFQSSDNLFFVMEYCAGGEFFRMLMKQPGHCLPEDSVRFYSAEVLLALEYLHMKGFVYRDLKPENILIHESGHLMLTDFDLSKHATSSSPQIVKKLFSTPQIFSAPELATNSFVGTAEYLAPEVIDGNQTQTGAVDWWTFGILIYEMMYGTTPFRGRSQDDTFDHILKDKIKFPDQHTFPVSSSAKSLIKGLLQRDSKKRLGAHQGSHEIKKHKFYDGKINFTLIRNEKPPLIPKISHPEDTSHFRTFEKDEDIFDSEIRDDYRGPFASFTSIEKTGRTTVNDEQLHQISSHPTPSKDIKESKESKGKTEGGSHTLEKQNSKARLEDGHRSSSFSTKSKHKRGHSGNHDDDNSEAKSEKISHKELEKDTSPKLDKSSSKINKEDSKSEKSSSKLERRKDEDSPPKLEKEKSSKLNKEDGKSEKSSSKLERRKDEDSPPKLEKEKSSSKLIETENGNEVVKVEKPKLEKEKSSNKLDRHKDDEEREHRSSSKHKSHHKDDEEREHRSSSKHKSHHKDDEEREHKSRHKDDDDKERSSSASRHKSHRDDEEREHKSRHKDDDDKDRKKSLTPPVDE